MKNIKPKDSPITDHRSPVAETPQHNNTASVSKSPCFLNSKSKILNWE